MEIPRKKDLRSTVQVVDSIWNDSHTINYIGKSGFICSFFHDYVDVSIKGEIITFHRLEVFLK